MRTKPMLLMLLLLSVPLRVHAVESLVTPLTASRVANLLRMALPQPQESNVNCHGTSFYANGILSVLIPISTDVAFVPECFARTEGSQPGDIGVFSMMLGPQRLYTHSFTVLQNGHLFHKANPGPTFPFEILPGQSVSDAHATFRPEYRSDDLHFYRYSPSPACWVTRVQAAIDVWRGDPVYAGLIRVVEAAAGGASLPSDPVSYAVRVEQLDAVRAAQSGQLPDTRDPRWAMIAIYGEYLRLPSFRFDREALGGQRRDESARLLKRIQRALAATSSVPEVVRGIIRRSGLYYRTLNLGLDGDSRTAYLEIERDEFDQLTPFSIRTRGLSISIINRNLVVKSSRHTWTYIFDHNEQVFESSRRTSTGPNADLNNL